MTPMRSQEPLSADAHSTSRKPCTLGHWRYGCYSGYRQSGRQLFIGATLAALLSYSRSNGQIRATIGHDLSAYSRSQRLAIGDSTGWLQGTHQSTWRCA